MKNILLLFIFLFQFSILAFGQEGNIGLTLLSTFNTGIFDDSGAEIVAHDPNTQRLFFTNAEDNSIIILDISDPTAPTVVNTIQVDDLGDINSVDVAAGIIGAAIANDSTQLNGIVAFYTSDGNFIGSTEVGALPDMIQMTRFGLAFTANEGEPNDDYTVDPLGSLSIIDFRNIPDTIITATATLDIFDPDEAAIRASGVRLFGLGASVGQDLEPEYVQFDEVNNLLYAICQENNTLLILNFNTNPPELLIAPLGFKDHSLPGNGFDASNRDGEINIQNWPVFGMYQPDAFRVATYAGGTWLFTANEGDSRDYDGFSEEERIADLDLDPDAFPNADELQMDENLGRLKVTTTLGDTDGDGDYDELYAYGARSFSVWNGLTGQLVWDSGDEFEQVIAEEQPEFFNSTNDDNDSFDNRSDDKGPEPEAIEIAVVDTMVYAFIGLERHGGIMIYNVTDPTAPSFVDFVNNRDFSVDAELEEAGDLGIEDIKFIAPDDSPTGDALIVTANEVSGTVSIFSIDAVVVSSVTLAQGVSLEAFPNPIVSGSLNILSEKIDWDADVDVQVVDVTGATVLSPQINRMSNDRAQIDLSSLMGKTATYYLTIRQQNEKVATITVLVP